MTIEETQIPSAESVDGTTATEETQVVEPSVEDNPTSETTETGSFFDPNTVPEELKPAYKQMQAAFTKKTQEIAEARKEAEAIRAKAEAYDRVQQERLQLAQNAPRQSPELEALKLEYKAQGYDDQTIEFMTRGLQFTLDHVNQTLTAQQETARITSQIGEAAKVDPRLSDASLTYQTEDGAVTFGQIVEEMVAADPKWRQDPVSATRRAIRKVDALIGKAKTDGKEELSNSTKVKARQFPAAGGSPQGATSTAQAMSIRDAAKAAEKETGLRWTR